MTLETFLNSARMAELWAKIKSELDKKRNKTDNPLEGVTFHISDDGDLIADFTESQTTKE